MTELEDRVTRIEQQAAMAFALDRRLKDLEDALKKQQPRSTVRDWLQTLGPYLTGLIVLFVGYALKDSVTMAMQREQLDLAYVKDVRELVQGFDSATEQSAADANAIALAMYGRYAIVPLTERLQGGDVAQLAAERGLRLIGANEPAAACAQFARLLSDVTRHYTWQTHRRMVGLMGVSECVPQIGLLEGFLTRVTASAQDQKQLPALAERFSNADAFDVESAERLEQELQEALRVLRLQRERGLTADRREAPWWR